MAEQFRALTALAEDPGSVPGIISQLTTPVPGDPAHSLLTSGHQAQMWYTDIHAGKMLIYSNNL